MWLRNWLNKSKKFPPELFILALIKVENRFTNRRKTDKIWKVVILTAYELLTAKTQLSEHGVLLSIASK